MLALVQLGDTFRLGNDIPGKVSFLGLFSQNKGSSLALLEVACFGCAALLSSDNLATLALPCSSPGSLGLGDVNSFRTLALVHRFTFLSVHSIAWCVRYACRDSIKEGCP